MLVDHRRLLRERKLWLGLLIGSLGLLPIVFWNAVHNWASFRWQLSHATFNVAGESSLMGNAFHALAYLTWPLVVLALAGLGAMRLPAERLLGLAALFMILPVALSPVNSPRNLSTGLALLLLVAGARLPDAFRGRQERWTTVFMLAGLTLTVLYGAGTVAGLSAPARWPHSSVVSAIRQDAAGWRDLGRYLADQPEQIFALDYSIASQIRYYTDQPAQTAWGQYRIWGIPEFEDVTVISLVYLPVDVISSRLSQAFQKVEGPQALRYSEHGADKEVRVWQAEGLQLDQPAFLEMFDFLTLLEASR